jgi:tRNA-2-methylthio-N6-dimethylallyladenosine synthase
MKPLTVYCESFGCQMNAYDSEVILSLMRLGGYRVVASPHEADVILVNTCSVRAHAEERAIGRLHDLSRHRRAALVVCGCMAQRLGETLFDTVPPIRGIAGPASYDRLVAAIDESIETGGRFSLLESNPHATYATAQDAPRGSVSRYLAITLGCENYCSYCIVPFLRGPVRSKSPETILSEAVTLLASGAREITLLGQNVVAYRFGDVDFLGLLQRILAETDARRLRFLTSHPKDMDLRIFELMARDSRLCPHVHVPVQAGSDRILDLMNRGYTRDAYVALVREARRIVPGLALTTDVIVGFPTELDIDFQATLELLREVRFDAAFTFMYSVREGTAASRLDDDVPRETKKDRLKVLNDVVSAIRGEILAAEVGRQTEILLDGTVQKGEHLLWKGRTPHFRNVVVAGDHLRDGNIVSVRLTRLNHFTFEGDVCTPRDRRGNV